MSCSTLSFCDVEWSEEKTIESWMQKIRSRTRRRRRRGEEKKERRREEKKERRRRKDRGLSHKKNNDCLSNCYSSSHAHLLHPFSSFSSWVIITMMMTTEEGVYFFLSFLVKPLTSVILLMAYSPSFNYFFSQRWIRETSEWKGERKRKKQKRNSSPAMIQITI